MMMFISSQAERLVSAWETTRDSIGFSANGDTLDIIVSIGAMALLCMLLKGGKK